MQSRYLTVILKVGRGVTIDKFQWGFYFKIYIYIICLTMQNPKKNQIFQNLARVITLIKGIGGGGGQI